MRYKYPRFDKLLTANDAVYRLVDRAGAFTNDARTERLCFRAIQEAVREVPIKHPWGYYKRLIPVVFDGPVERDVTPLSINDRLVLHSVDPWPDNALLGHVILDGMFIKVIDFDSEANAITVDFPADVFGGTTVRWVHRVAEIPDVQKVIWMRDAHLGHEVRAGLPQDVSSRDVARTNSSGVVTHFTVANSNVLGLTDLIIHPSPSYRQAFLVFIELRPRPVIVHRDEFSSCVIVGPRSFTTTMPVFNWPGCVVRVATHLASGKATALREGRFNWQSIITDVDETTGMVTVADDLPSGFGAEDVLVSSLVDIDVPTMQNYIEALAYSMYCLNHKHEGLGKALDAEYRRLGEARALDKKFDWSAIYRSECDELESYFGSGGSGSGGTGGISGNALDCSGDTRLAWVDTGLAWLDSCLLWE